jgi:hypothetical protein
MRIKNIIKKNIFLILLLAVVVLFGIAYYKTTEGFQATNCNFNYCTGNFEVVNSRCIKKCSAFTSTKSVAASSDPMLCIVSVDKKEVTRFYRTENYKNTQDFKDKQNKFKQYNINLDTDLIKNNREGNNACECPSGNFSHNSKCYKNCTSPYNQRVAGTASCKANSIVSTNTKAQCNTLKGEFSVSSGDKCTHCPKNKSNTISITTGCIVPAELS